MEGFRQDPGLSAVFSFLFSGLGQIYNGQIKKGLAVIFFSTISLLVFIAGSILIALYLLEKVVVLKILILGVGLALAGSVGIGLLGAYSIFDAYNRACRK